MAPAALRALTAHPNPAPPDIPRSIALPAATASLAYLNAKYGLLLDARTIYLLVSYARHTASQEKADRVNGFYAFERWATEPRTRDRVFLVSPYDPAAQHPRPQREWTYAEAYEIVGKYARWLREVHGVQKGEIVAMDFTNREQFVWVWFALWSLGAKPAFINSNLRRGAFVHCVRVSTARLLLVDPLVREVLDEETRGELGADSKGRAVDAFVLEDEAVERDILSGPAYRAPDSERGGDKLKDTAMLIFTSGTTGLPKAAKVHWGKTFAGTYVFPKLLGITAEDRYFTAMPLYHTSASLLGVLQALGPGCAIIVAPKFSPRTYMRMVTETQATIMQYIGEACRYLVVSPKTEWDRKHKLRLAFGNGMRPDVWQPFKDRFNIPDICEFYGATEAPGSSWVYERTGFERGAIGRSGALVRSLFGGNNVLVRHDHTTDLPYRDPRTNHCVKCLPNEPGELLNLLDPAAISDKFVGYLGNDAAGSSKILRDVFKKGDAYYRTGDLQRLDSDGRWWFLDRVGDTFRWKGENVSTAEVSEALGSHPAVGEANVYGVVLPHHDGRAGCAAVSLVGGKGVEGGLGVELAEWVRRRLPRYAVPVFLRVVGTELEVTGTMKHQKVALRNAGVDPGKVGGDKLFWLPPGAEGYEVFGVEEWEGIVERRAKL
ncbi:long-chain fatty acid transporter fat1 [Friedmanniomyces endolithicus]|uniref:Very long-chain fatty acid transport protein n=1 Tax=Friedmanniomyces endolithicus TaxID=329885 RepID=A0AAN6QYE2_9PEZI|nr:long-chain fatty acid transporter fat1 [Friedmanniomyces endolithicus]KAK0995844.1 long-chain fatty acid transporter fat1 [Friedmanniomyces endolithicus]KAK1005957.1 long-chain fatty acid transporter fat1 [Friedmanniomyces endolithicus]KAK1044050.1 long-chain fatty acid transporter fat1 [Friedmanniomyces endolithicus]